MKHEPEPRQEQKPQIQLAAAPGWPQQSAEDEDKGLDLLGLTKEASPPVVEDKKPVPKGEDNSKNLPPPASQQQQQPQAAPQPDSHKEQTEEEEAKKPVHEEKKAEELPHVAAVQETSEPAPRKEEEEEKQKPKPVTIEHIEQAKEEKKQEDNGAALLEQTPVKQSESQSAQYDELAANVHCSPEGKVADDTEPIRQNEDPAAASNNAEHTIVHPDMMAQTGISSSVPAAAPAMGPAEDIKTNSVTGLPLSNNQREAEDNSPEKQTERGGDNAKHLVEAERSAEDEKKEDSPYGYEHLNLTGAQYGHNEPAVVPAPVPLPPAAPTLAVQRMAQELDAARKHARELEAECERQKRRCTELEEEKAQCERHMQESQRLFQTMRDRVEAAKTEEQKAKYAFYCEQSEMYKKADFRSAVDKLKEDRKRQQEEGGKLVAELKQKVL